MPEFVKVKYKSKLSKKEVHQIWENRKNFNDVCPFCQGDIEGAGVDVGEGSSYQECHCNECEAQWYDNYGLVAITVIV